MALSFDELTNRVKQQLTGYTKNQDQYTWLTADMTDSDVTFTVDPGTTTAVSRGICEIDDELLLVNRYDKNSGNVTVAAGTNGRGQYGTSAAAHSANSLVIADPDFPRSAIKNAINDSIRAVYPDLFVFGEVDIPKVAARYEYDLPAEVEQVYRVTTDTIGPSRVWFPNSSWRFNPQPSTTSDAPNNSTTGKTIQIMRDFIVPGRAMHVVYYKSPSILVNNDDDYETTTGLQERTYDVIMWGACARVVQAYEPARLQMKAVESTQRAPLVPAGSSSNAANAYWQLYYRRLQEEKNYLSTLYPEYVTFNG